MNFVWDEEKSKSNKRKHGIAFEEAKSLWLDENRVEIHAPYPLEERKIIIDEYENKAWTAIYTIRGEAVRMISVRQARKKEAPLYEEEGIARYKDYDYSQGKFIPIQFDRQITWDV